jgi:hypothetical protein
VEEYGRTRQATDGNVIRRTPFACWIPKTAGTHLEYVIYMSIAFPQPQWLSKRASIFPYTSIEIRNLCMYIRKTVCVYIYIFYYCVQPDDGL